MLHSCAYVIKSFVFKAIYKEYDDDYDQFLILYNENRSDLNQNEQNNQKEEENTFTESETKYILEVITEQGNGNDNDSGVDNSASSPPSVQDDLDRSEQEFDMESQAYRSKSPPNHLNLEGQQNATKTHREQATKRQKIRHIYKYVPADRNSIFSVVGSMVSTELRRKLLMNTWQASLVENTCNSHTLWISTAICSIVVFSSSRKYTAGIVIASLSLVHLAGCTFYFHWLRIVVFVLNMPFWQLIESLLERTTGFKVPWMLLIASLHLIWDLDQFTPSCVLIYLLVTAVQVLLELFPLIAPFLLDGFLVSVMFLVQRGLDHVGYFNVVHQLQHDRLKILSQINSEAMLGWAFTEFKGLLTEHNGCGTDSWTIIIFMLTHSIRVNLSYWIVRIPSVLRKIEPEADLHHGILQLFFFLLLFNATIASWGDQIYNVKWDNIFWLASSSYYLLLHPGRLHYVALTQSLNHRDFASSHYRANKTSLATIWRGTLYFQCRYVKYLMQIALKKNLRLYHFLSAQRNVLLTGLIIDLVKDLILPKAAVEFCSPHACWLVPSSLLAQRRRSANP